MMIKNIKTCENIVSDIRVRCESKGPIGISRERPFMTDSSTQGLVR